jgi:aspartate 1-decarboxylase
MPPWNASSLKARISAATSRRKRFEHGSLVEGREVGFALVAGWKLYLLGCGREPGRRHEPMLFYLLKSKIHRARVTGASLDYEGSLTIAEDLMEKVGLLPYERILCSNLANGARFETYAIKGKRGSGVIELNGATAHLGKAGDKLTIMAFTEVSGAKAKNWKPKVILLDGKNAVARFSKI